MMKALLRKLTLILAALIMLGAPSPSYAHSADDSPLGTDDIEGWLTGFFAIKYDELSNEPFDMAAFTDYFDENNADSYALLIKELLMQSMLVSWIDELALYEIDAWYAWYTVDIAVSNLSIAGDTATFDAVVTTKYQENSKINYESPSGGVMYLKYTIGIGSEAPFLINYTYKGYANEYDLAAEFIEKYAESSPDNKLDFESINAAFHEQRAMQVPRLYKATTTPVQKAPAKDFPVKKPVRLSRDLAF